MLKTNTAKEVKARIEKLVNDKTHSLSEIETARKKAEERQSIAKKRMKTAIEMTDADAYEKAKKEFSSAGNAVEMYTARFDQLNQKEFLTEEESDRVIDSLLQYEKDLEEDLIKSMEKPLKTIQKLCEDYTNNITETESAISAWTSSIHENYRRQGAIYQDGTNRSDIPVPVRVRPFLGCPTALITQSYLNKIKTNVISLKE